jgi:hypothetical protein
VTALPESASFTAATTNQAQFKDNLTLLRNYLAGVIGEAGDVATAQIALAVLFGAGIRILSSATSLALSDRGKVLLCSGTWPLTFPSGATAGVGFVVAVKNTGSGAITPAGLGGDTVDVSTIAAGTSYFFVWSGSQWVSIGGAGGSALPSVIGISQGGTGQTTAAAALSALAGKKIAAGYGGVGTPNLVQSGNSFTVGSLYERSVNGLSGTWRCMGRSDVLALSTDRIYIFERE